MKGLFSFLEKSHVFIAACASLLAVKTYLIAGVEISRSSVFLVLFSTWMVYNLSLLRLSFQSAGPSFFNMKIAGNRMNLFAVVIAVPVIAFLLSGISNHQVLWFMFTSVLTILYMMPFSVNGRPVNGLRSNWIIKNILLSAIWATATVLIPLSGVNSWPAPELVMMIYLRSFLFIYALTVIYDIRDMKSDGVHGMRTLAMVAGVSRVRVIAVIALFVFMLLSLSDPFVSPAVKWALSLSALFALAVVLPANQRRPRWYYTYAVDGAMAVQAALVILFHSQ